VTNLASKFRSVILCEDIRAEIGNKYSLMGVLGGDILVPSFPAIIKMAFFMEYLPDSDESATSIDFRLLQGDVEIAKGKFEATIPPLQSSIFVLPTALVSFEKNVILRFCVSISGEPEQEILSKKVGLVTS
jgi:hypothetical protein